MTTPAPALAATLLAALLAPAHRAAAQLPPATAVAAHATTAPAPIAGGSHDPSVDRPHAVDLALCLDTSGSMDGLIESAKAKLWAIVNELARAEPTPSLRVALLTYGNNGHAECDGWVRLDVPLTTDLDLVSQHLFGLATNGGTELVGRVVAAAMEKLSWASSDGALKLVVVAGNETADQDPERRYHEVCRLARERGFQVNAIYCDNGEPGVAASWEDVALLGSGYYAVIDQDNGSLAIDTPHDARLLELNASLNATYIPFGAAGQAGAANQVMQDSNAHALAPASMADRVVCKSGALYQCAWDLVDACASGQVQLETVPAADLPEALRALSLAERKAHVASQQAARARLQAEIAALNVERSAFQAAVRKEQSLDDSTAFDRVLRDAVRAQAQARGFLFPEPALGAEVSGPTAPDARRHIPRHQGLGPVLPPTAVAKPDDC